MSNLRKTVLLNRGPRGYGFNLAEEFPCFLSAVHENGVAWKSGLRSGDRLAAVNSMDVSRISHKDIVRMIADSGDALRLTVTSTIMQESSEALISSPRKEILLTSSDSSSSDCDSDNEIWRRKKSDLAQRFQQKRPRRSRFKNLITPISEALMEDGIENGGLRKRGRRYISAVDQPPTTKSNDQRLFCPLEQPIFGGENRYFDDKPFRSLIDQSPKIDYLGENRLDDRRQILHSAIVNRRNASSPPSSELRQSKRRPVSILNSDDVLSTPRTIDRCSRSPAKSIKKRATSGNDRKKSSDDYRSASAPDYKRGLYPKSITDASTIARVGLIDTDRLSSNDEASRGESSLSENEDDDDDEEEDLIKKSVVVYIGAVPIPNVGASRKNILKAALQSLRAQRVRAHTVLLEIFSNQIVITNSKGVMTNRFRADRIAYATSCAENKQYFGLTTVVMNRERQNRSSRTTTTNDETDESPMTPMVPDGAMVCHVFAVDPQLHLHSFHYHYARKFGIHCVRDPETNFCQEFPYSSNSILHAIGYVYRNHRNNNLLNYRYSYDSTAAAAIKGPLLAGAGAYVSSNSDSGIGNGRDDFSPSSMGLKSSILPPAYPGTSTRFQSKIEQCERFSSPMTPPKSTSDELEKEKICSSGKKSKAVRFIDDQQANGDHRSATSERIDRGAIAISRDLDFQNQAYSGADNRAALTCVQAIPHQRRVDSSTMKNQDQQQQQSSKSNAAEGGRRYATISGASTSSVFSLATIDSSRSASGVRAVGDETTQGSSSDVDRHSTSGAFPKSVSAEKPAVEQRTKTGPLEATTTVGTSTTRLVSASSKPNAHYQTHYQQKGGEENFHQVRQSNRDQYDLEHLLHNHPYLDDQRRHSYHHTLTDSGNNLDETTTRIAVAERALISNAVVVSSNAASVAGSTSGRRKSSQQLLFGFHKQRPRDSSQGRTFSGGALSILKRVGGAAAKSVSNSTPRLLADDSANVVDGQRLAPNLGYPPDKTLSQQDLLDADVNSISPASSTSRKESKDQSGVVRSTVQSSNQTHYVSSSAIDVRQLANSGKNSKGPLGVTKSAAVGHSALAGSAGEIRARSPQTRNLGGSIEQLTTSTSSKPQASSSSSSSKQHQQHQQVVRENCAGSVSSLLSSESGGLHQQQVFFESNPRCSTAPTTTTATKHGSLLRDRINRRLNRNPNPQGETQNGAGIRTSSIRMKQALKERLEAWSSDFDRLLRDPAGLYAFSEFLRTQYCQENVNFWIACENYKLSDENMRTLIATELYRNYFATGCMEPVNVDSLARQMIQEAMETENFTSATFNPAQYQIFHLMKYDCYPRFLKSDEYQRCWDSSEKGQQLPEMKEPFLNNADSGGVGSSLSLTNKNSNTGGDGEQKKSAASSRKSILPWKNKFTSGVNIIGRHKGKKDEEANAAAAAAAAAASAAALSTNAVQQPSTSAPFGLASHGHGGESALKEMNAGLSSVGSKRKQAWRHSKQLSTPADVTHAVRKPSGSVEGLHHHPLHSRPNSGLAASRPPDVVPQPDPPSSPSPGPHPKNAAHSQQPTKPAPPSSPLLSTVVQHHGNATTIANEGGKFSCTLILPSRERIQAAVSEDLTVRRWLHELALRYALNAAATDIIDVETDEPVDLATNASRALAGKTVRLEGGVLFKVDLPCSGASTPASSHASESTQRKLIAVKARADSAAGQVLRPILNKYGLQLDSMVVCVAGTNEVLPNHSPISLANNKKLMVLTQSEFEDWVHRDHDAASLLSSRSSPSRSSLSPSFEDIIGAKYFQELPSHKGLGIAELPPEPDGTKTARHHHHHQQQQNAAANGGGGGGHKHGAGGMLKFVKRGAAEATSSAATKILGQQTKSLRLSSHPQPHHQHQQTNLSTQQQSSAPGKKLVLSKQELIDMAREEKKLAELLGRAQASSFDDQRGSCVKNFELPDFLKQPTPLAISHLQAVVGVNAATGGSAAAQSSSMDDSLIPSSSTGVVGVSSQQSTFHHSRPTDLVHRKLCGGVGVGVGDEIGTGGLSTASGSCDDDFVAYEPLSTDRRQSDDLLKCVVTINGEQSELLLLGESKIPSHDEAEALFGGSNDSDEPIDFGDPLMTERRRLSDFGLGVRSTIADSSSDNNFLDNTIRSVSIGDRVSNSSTPPRAPPPPYQQRTTINYSSRSPTTSTPRLIKNAATPDASPANEPRKTAVANVGDAAGAVVDQDKKRKGLYVHHQDDDWQVDYV